MLSFDEVFLSKSYYLFMRKTLSSIDRNGIPLQKFLIKLYFNKGVVKLMKFLNIRPKLRLVFLASYLATAVWIMVKKFSFIYIVAGLLFLFGCYISLVKAEVIKDSRADNIDNFSFDFVSFIIILVLVFDIVFSVL
jgi:hypothetical protein